ncbi:PQQ-dependent sugar dehydrogenase [Spirosoma aerolatum]|uniref:PQQ-dependent sugar dehydrogenase n=1 Tax=Spirosoma aerolatum TaxID=1211326 RepID=UPI0009AEDFAE|nr:PQQ-dependent sugar dehydrogenase [Spirosoma aerolatum]
MTFSLRYLYCLPFLALVWLTVPNNHDLSVSDRMQTMPDDLPGKALFKTHCVSCHALEQDGIGPKLGGITRLLSEKELIAFMKNPQKAIESGNARAVSLSKRYKMIMPGFDFLKDDELKSIVAYIADETQKNNSQPLVVSNNTGGANTRLTEPVAKSNLTIELEEFVTIPPSSDKMPRTRIATMRAHPSGDGTQYVSDQRGLIYRIAGKEASTFLDVRPLIENFINEPGLGTGLGSFAFHPDFLKNGLIYTTHTESFKGKRADYSYSDSVEVALQWVVSEWHMDDLTSPIFTGKRRELLRVNMPSSAHGIQDIGFNPEALKDSQDYGKLYIGIGDGGSTINKHPELCHKLTSLLGTLIRIDPLGRNSKNGQYTIPADNPFVAENDPAIYTEIYAYGFRNPHRQAWYQGRLFCTDVGESNFEEVNVIQKGGDYGWNVREGNYGISSKDLKNVYPVPDTKADRFIRPFLQYDHLDGNAISGGYVYEGPIEALKNKYVFGDIARGRVFFANIDKNLTDHSVQELTIMQDGKPTNLVELSGSKRVDLRITYDRFTKEMYIMTKSDGKIRRIKKAGYR